MNSLNLKTYLIYAIYIVRTNPLILVFLAAFGMLNGFSVYFPENNAANFISSLTVVSAIFISPVIYGIYYEIIEDKYSSVANIFRTYVGGYLVLLFCMYIPIITTTALILSTSQAGANVGGVMLTILIFSLLFIYVVPTYYISGTIIDSIIFGVRFFFNNLISSAPLLLMALFAELLLLFSHFNLGDLRETSPFLFVMVDFTVYMIASIIDFLLFIMLIYVLRTQQLKKR